MAVSRDGQTSQTHQPRSSRTRFWLLLSVAIAFLYRLPALHNAFSGLYVVQDDARQHVFWMQRFADPALFPNDLTADYFQSVAPWGYTTLYKAAVALGLDVWTFNKSLPIFIAVIATVFAFGTILELVSVPVAAFVGATFLNQTFPLRDDIVSATPAAFFQPFFLAFLYFTLRRSWLPCAIAIALMGTFYPQGVLMMAGTLTLMGLSQIRYKPGKFFWRGTSADLRLIGSGWLAAFLVLLPYALRDSAFGPVVTVAQAREMFAFMPGGWSRFFDPNWLDFWLFGKRSGLFPFEWATLDFKIQPQIWLTAAVPFLLLLPGRSPLARQAASRLSLLLQVVIASVVCFGLAHWLLFELHLPNRYTEHSLRAVIAIASGAAIALILDRLRPTQPSPTRLRPWAVWLTLWAIAPLLLSFMAGETRGNYIHGQHPELYEFLATQPKETVVVSLDKAINEVPSFAQRSILVGGEGFTLPYHLGYYNEVKQRSVDLIEAQYATDPGVVKTFLDNYPIDFWLISQAMFTPEWIYASHWLLQYAEITDAPQALLNNLQPTVIQELAPSCQTARSNELLILDANCLQTKLSNSVP